jgi:hypothetical protein
MALRTGSTSTTSPNARDVILAELKRTGGSCSKGKVMTTAAHAGRERPELGVLSMPPESSVRKRLSCVHPVRSRHNAIREFSRKWVAEDAATLTSCVVVVCSN